MTKKNTHLSFYKQISVIRSINAATTTKIEEIIGGSGSLKSKFDGRTRLQQSMAKKYEGSYNTWPLRLKYLHTFAINGFAVDFSTAYDGEPDDE